MARKSFLLPSERETTTDLNEILPKDASESHPLTELLNQTKGDDYLQEVLDSKREARESRETIEPEDIPEPKTPEPKEQEKKGENFSPEYLATAARMEAIEAERKKDKEELAAMLKQQQAAQVVRQPQQQATEEPFDYDLEGLYKRTINAEKKVQAIEERQQREQWNQAIGNQYARMKAEAKAVAEMPEFKQFAEYFPESHVNQVFDKIAKAGNWEYLRNIDWKHELQAAYKAKDYDRLHKEHSELTAKQQAAVDKAKETRQANKEALKLVGKPGGSASGANTTANRSGVGVTKRSKNKGFEALQSQFKSLIQSRA